MRRHPAPRLVAATLAAGAGAPADDSPGQTGPWEVLSRIWSDGDAVLPLPDDEREAARLVADLSPDAVLTSGGASAPGPDGSRPSGRRLPDLPPDAALVVPTSGTTGRSLGVVLPRSALDAAVDASLARIGGEAGDRWLCCLPLVHVAGVLVLARAAALGTRPIMQRRFDVAAVAAALRAPSPPTHVSLVPTMLHRLLEAGVDLRGLRGILLGGAAADPALLARARAAGAPVVTTYGMTETCGGVVYDGVPLDGVGAAVDPDGRILLSGPTLASGYRDGTRLPLTDGWFATPDHGNWGPGGRLEVRGRLDDVVITGGENVDTAAVAARLSAHPTVASAAVTGVPDAEWGQRIEAWIVPAHPVDEAGLAGIVAFLTDQLPAFAVPKHLHVVERLPRTALGKVAREALRDLPAVLSWPTS